MESLLALFASAFVSATLFPGGSEVLFVYLLQNELAGQLGPAWLAATLGNSLGGMSSWLIGLLAISNQRAQRYLQSHAVALQRIRHWGSPALLLSWLPIIGDPLCLAAGLAGVSWRTALLLITMGKGLRYGVLLYLVI